MIEINILEKNGKSEPASSASPASALAPASKFDPDEYRADIADLALTKEQEAEFLQTLWSIMGHFARLGYAVDVCGLIFSEFNEASALAAADAKLPSSTNMESASKPDGGTA